MGRSAWAMIMAINSENFARNDRLRPRCWPRHWDAHNYVTNSQKYPFTQESLNIDQCRQVIASLSDTAITTYQILTILVSKVVGYSSKKSQYFSAYIWFASRPQRLTILTSYSIYNNHNYDNFNATRCRNNETFQKKPSTYKINVRQIYIYAEMQQVVRKSARSIVPMLIPSCQLPTFLNTKLASDRHLY